MPRTAMGGQSPPTTADEPCGHNSDGCAFCPADADGYDATAEAPLCRDCSDRFSDFLAGGAP